MQIDDSDEQRRNACLPICESWELGSNATLETQAFPQKQWPYNDSIPLGIVMASSNPKYLMIEEQSKSTKKRSLILKCELPAPIEMSSRPA
jgi:hypothetical protein